MKIIIYGSKYGTAEQYAAELSRKTGIDAFGYNDIDDVNSYDTLIYIGALYAGSVMGMKKTLGKITNADTKKIIIATVGLADPHDSDNQKRIRYGIQKQLPGDVYDSAEIYFLRGAIDYSRLSIKHKAMMAVVHKKAERMDEKELDAEVKAVLETYGKNISYVDFDALDSILNNI